VNWKELTAKDIAGPAVAAAIGAVAGFVAAFFNVRMQWRIWQEKRSDEQAQETERQDTLRITADASSRDAYTRQVQALIAGYELQRARDEARIQDLTTELQHLRDEVHRLRHALDEQIALCSTCRFRINSGGN
jgi:chromosome segregation ATPase